MKKRILSIILAVGMLASVMPAASANVFTQPSLAGQFNAFGGYVKTSAATDLNNLVEGWGDRSEQLAANGIDPALKAGNYGTFSQSDNVTGNSYIKIANGTQMIKILDEVAAKGILHLSFDYMYGGDESGKAFYVEGIKNTSNNLTQNPYASGTTLDDINMFCIKHDSEYIKAINHNYAPENPTQYFSGWHKVDIVFDFDNTEYYAYLDGILLGNIDANVGIKALRIRDTSTFDRTGMYLDNVALYHYSEKDGITRVELAVDCGSVGVMTTAGGKLNVGFSEYIEGYTPSTADFKIKNIENGKTVTPATASKTDTGVVLTLGAIDAGEYEVEFVNGDVVGKISEKSIGGKAMFSAKGEVTKISQTEDDRCLLSEDFEAYNGGMPAGWAPLLTAQTVANEVQNIEKTTGKAGDALKLKGNGDIFFEFPNPIASGKLNIEFDMNTADGIWGMGFLHGKDFADTSVFEPNTIEANTTLDDRRKNSLLIGNASASEGDAVSLKYNVKRVSGLASEKADVLVSKNTWNHIKLVYDFEGRKTDVTIGDVTTSFNMNDYYFFAYPYKQTEDGSKSTSFYGFKGLRIAALGGEGVSVDNIKIYTDNSYNLYEDFNDWKDDTTSKHRASMFAYDNARQMSYHNITLEAGRTGESGDKAIKITRTQNGGLVMPLVSPVTKNHDFNVEFDFKQDGVGYSNTLALGLLAMGDYNIGSTNSTSVKGNERVVFATSGYREGYETHADDVKAGSLFLGGGGLNYGLMPLFTSSGDKNSITSYDIEVNKWYHINLKVRGKLYNLDVTNEAGVTSSFYMIDGTKAVLKDGAVALSSDKLNSYSKQVNNDTYAIGFFNPRAKYQTGGVSTTIDNIKVYEVNAPVDACITDTKVVYPDKETNFSSVIKTNAEKIEVAVSAPFRTSGVLNNTTYNALVDISMIYADTGETVTENIVLSDDLMSATATFDEEVDTGRPVVFSISNKALRAGSYVGSEKALNLEFMFEEAAENIKVDDFRLYEYQTAGNVAEWTPVIKATLGDYSAEDMFRVSVTGRNDYKTQKTLTAFFAGYDSTTNTLVNIVQKTVSVDPNGQFDIAIYSNNVPAELAGENAIMIDLSQFGDRIKCFLWDGTTTEPMALGLNYAMWAEAE